MSAIYGTLPPFAPLPALCVDVHMFFTHAAVAVAPPPPPPVSAAEPAALPKVKALVEPPAFSADYMQIHRTTLVIVILALVCVLISITIITYAPSQIIQNVIAASTTSTSSPSANGSNITLGSPQAYTEYDKTTSFNMVLADAGGPTRRI